MAALAHEIALARARAERRGRKLAVRLNGTSDLPWESYPVNDPRYLAPNLMCAFPNVQFYDYTKNPIRMRRFLIQLDWPSNYHLTFSRSETNDADVASLQAAGATVAIVATADAGVDGNAHDLTFLHPNGSTLWLTPKGPARGDESGFVLR